MVHQLNSGFLSHFENTRSESFDFGAWIKELEDFRCNLYNWDWNTSQHIKGLVQYLKKEVVTITFGGHFSAGKSTLLNSLISQDLLPVNDLPETGVICYLTKGFQDNALIKYSSNCRSIPFTSEAIEKEISLLTDMGDYQFHNEKEGLYITLKGNTIPNNVCWIDSPGINDSGINGNKEMETCAKRAAGMADTLFWIVNSKQIFAEVEAQFLWQHINDYGPDSVVFVLNIFLSQDTHIEWEKAKNKFLPAFYNKLRSFAQTANLSENWFPRVIAVSGRGMNHLEKEFGWNDINTELSARSHINNVKVQKVRAFYITQQLKKISELLERKISSEEAKLGNLKREWEKFNKDRNNLLSNLYKEIESFLKILDYKFSQSGIELVERIRKDPIKRDDSYSNDLSNSLSQILNAELMPFFERIGFIVNNYNFNLLNLGELYNSIFNLLTPGRLIISVPNTDLKLSTVAKGAGLGAAAGTVVVPVIGTVVGAIGGGLTALFKSAVDAEKIDVTLLDNTINLSLQQVRMNLENVQAQIISSIHKNLSYKIYIEPYDETNLQRLDWQCEKLASMIAAVN